MYYKHKGEICWKKEAKKLKANMIDITAPWKADKETNNRAIVESTQRRKDGSFFLPTNRTAPKPTEYCTISVPNLLNNSLKPKAYCFEVSSWFMINIYGFLRCVQRVYMFCVFVSSLFLLWIWFHRFRHNSQNVQNMSRIRFIVISYRIWISLTSIESVPFLGQFSLSSFLVWLLLSLLAHKYTGGKWLMLVIFEEFIAAHIITAWLHYQ